MILKMSRETAAKYGLLVCKCGHHHNNHFQHQAGQPCAHCECKVYRERGREGIRILSRIKPVKEARR